MSVHPDDVLLVGNLRERQDHPAWPERQVISAARPDRLRGRRVRNAYYTASVEIIPRVDLFPAMRGGGGSVLSIAEWRPEATTLLDQIAALPEQAASSSRDFGRGYALAIRDVLALLGAQQ